MGIDGMPMIRYQSLTEQRNEKEIGRHNGISLLAPTLSSTIRMSYFLFISDEGSSENNGIDTAIPVETTVAKKEYSSPTSQEWKIDTLVGEHSLPFITDLTFSSETVIFLH